MAGKAYKISEGNPIYSQFINYKEDRVRFKKAKNEIHKRTGIKNYVGRGSYIVAVKKEEMTEEALKLYESSIKVESKDFKGYYKIRSNSKLDKEIESIKKECGFKGIDFMMALYFDLVGRGGYIQNLILPEDIGSEENCFWLNLKLDNDGEIKIKEENQDENIKEMKLSEWYALKEKADELEKEKVKK